MALHPAPWTSEPLWRIPSAWPTLAPDQVHVWRGWLDPPDPAARRLADMLLPDERDRGDRYRFPRDARRFAVARGLLRCLLGRYLGMAPGQLRFSYLPQGKPYLAPDQGASLAFNVTHADDLGLFAVALDRRVGVDVERLQAIPEMASIAAQQFSPEEYARWLATAGDEKTAAFYRCWTLKEAYLKALGDGLARPLREFSVSLAHGGPDGLLDTREPDEGRRWMLRGFSPHPGYAAALAVEGLAAPSFLEADPGLLPSQSGQFSTPRRRPARAWTPTRQRT